MNTLRNWWPTIGGGLMGMFLVSTVLSCERNQERQLQELELIRRDLYSIRRDTQYIEGIHRKLSPTTRTVKPTNK